MGRRAAFVGVPSVEDRIEGFPSIRCLLLYTKCVKNAREISFKWHQAGSKECHFRLSCMLPTISYSKLLLHVYAIYA